MHHTKFKGDVGVTFVIHDLTKKEYHISVPITEHAPFDLVATKGDKVFRIQVKYRTVQNGAMEVNLFNAWGNSTKGCVMGKKYNANEVDYFAVTDGNVVAYVPSTLCEEQTCFYIRVEPSKNNQRKGVRLIEDYQVLV